jgi:hypothetical protein
MATKNFKDIAYQDINTKSAVSTIRDVPSARRHALKIGRIKAEAAAYENRKSKSKNLVAAPTDRIAIFANEYIPNHFSEDNWVSYTMSVNGKDYSISPLNSNKPGVKIIKYSKFKDSEPHAIILDEPIKEAYLTIMIKTPNAIETPFVSNLKVITGKGV